MPIVIQELIASDTISQAVDKINFNFDQLILNGGGPVGPSGPPGPIGPIGGRGIRGSKWYEDITATPGSDPNGIIFTGLEKDDNYLQANGDVWNWNGTAWTITPVNLTGPQGPAGITAGFIYFGSNVPSLPRFRNSIYPAVFGPGDGANVLNEGISTAVFGASISNDTLYPGSLGLSELTDTLAASLDSSLVSTLIHVKSTSAKSIVFSGGDSGSYYEQDILGDLSNITLSDDDTLLINVPKAPTKPSSDLIGFRLITDLRGQQYRAGKNIQFTTGIDPTSYPVGTTDTADFSVSVNGYAGLTTGPKISLDVVYAPSTALIQIGNIGTLPTTTTKAGAILLEADEIRSVSTNTIGYYSGDLIRLESATFNYEIVTPPIVTPPLDAEYVLGQKLADNSIYRIDLSDIVDLSWKLGGNTGNNALTDYFGTTDATDVLFKTGGSTGSSVDHVQLDNSLKTTIIGGGTPVTTGEPNSVLQLSPGTGVKSRLRFSTSSSPTTTDPGTSNGFEGGAEIMGPFGADTSLLVGTEAAAGQSALRIKSATKTSLGIRVNPGAIFIYVPPGQTGGLAAAGTYRTNDLSLWASGDVTIGRDRNVDRENEITPATNDATRGPVSIFGKGEAEYAGGQNDTSLGTYTDKSDVNVGGEGYERTSLKVWGDINGDFHYDTTGGDWSGPDITAQQVKSGSSDGWSSWIIAPLGTNGGPNDAGNPLSFAYKYSWQRTGRVVTLSGEIKWEWGSGGVPGSGSPLQLWQLTTTAAAQKVWFTVGPIPLPIQVAQNTTAPGYGRKQDSGAGTSLRGVAANTLVGTVIADIGLVGTEPPGEQQLIDPVGGTSLGSVPLLGIQQGLVLSGSTTIANVVESTNLTLNSQMWLKIFQQNPYAAANSTEYGLIFPRYKFTATYQLNE